MDTRADDTSEKGVFNPKRRPTDRHCTAQHPHGMDADDKDDGDTTDEVVAAFSGIHDYKDTFFAR